MKKLLPYAIGVGIILVLMIVGLKTGSNYGISWDEYDQRYIGTLAYNYVFNSDNSLLTYEFRHYGTGFELPLVWLEKIFHYTDTRDIYIMRHQVTHILFLLSALAMYVMAFRLTRNTVLATITTLAFALCPRIYAHSFFNPKDLPFLSVFTIALAVAQITFSRDRLQWYILLGIIMGYNTGIRVMGIMLFGFILIMLLLDYFTATTGFKKKRLLNLTSFAVAFFITLYICWPYLWLNPISNFMESYTVMSHYAWDGQVLLKGVFEHSTELPSGYFPSWFSITVPVLWLAAGIAGLLLACIFFFKNIKVFLRNTNERFYMLAVLCFLFPVFAVIQLHSVIYDDWRHLYFVYPPFCLLILYLMQQFYNRSKAVQYSIWGAAAIQVALIVSFMMNNHPFQQVYFNELVSHEPEYLRQNYEMEYWGCSFKEALEFIAAKDKSDSIRISGSHPTPLVRNLMILPAADRNRFIVTDFNKASYFLTNFRGHPDEYPDNKNPSKDIDLNIKVLNSSVMRVYNLKKINHL